MKIRMMLLLVLAASRFSAHASEPSPAVFAGARVLPAFKEGVCQGFKLYAVQPDSQLAKAGIENGDIVRTINGRRIDSPNHLLEALASTADGELADFEVSRSGSVLHVKVRVGQS